MADESVTPKGEPTAGAPQPSKPHRASRSQRDEGPGSGFVPRNVIVALAVLVVLAAAFVFYSLVVFWPTTPAKDVQRVDYFGSERILSRDTLFFLVVAFGGALGGLIHTIRSITWYTGNRNLRWSWMLFNLMLPIVGALAGVVFYVVLRAGLFSPSTGSNDTVNAYGFTAVAIMAGLFSEQAMEKLRQIATDLFSPRPQGEDHTPPENKPATDTEKAGDSPTPTTSGTSG
jgi:hypothetical protein